MVRTFGIRFEEGGFDEGEHQTQMVSFLGTGHTELQASNEKIGAALADVLWHCEKPLLRTGPVPLFMLSDAVHRKGVNFIMENNNLERVGRLKTFLQQAPRSALHSVLHL